MGQVYTRRLVLVASGATGAVTDLFTCGPSETIVVRDIILAAAAGTPPYVVDVFLSPVTSGTYPIVHTQLETLDTWHQDLRVGMESGDKLQLRSSSPAGYTTVTVTGYVFLL